MLTYADVCCHLWAGLENVNRYLWTVVEHIRRLVRVHNLSLPTPLASSSPSPPPLAASSKILHLSEAPVHCSPHYTQNGPKGGGGGHSRARYRVSASMLSRMLAYAHVCSRMLTHADGMLTYARYLVRASML